MTRKWYLFNCSSSSWNVRVLFFVRLLLQQLLLPLSCSFVHYFAYPCKLLEKVCRTRWWNGIAFVKLIYIIASHCARCSNGLFVFFFASFFITHCILQKQFPNQTIDTMNERNVIFFPAISYSLVCNVFFVLFLIVCFFNHNSPNRFIYSLYFFSPSRDNNSKKKRKFWRRNWMEQEKKTQSLRTFSKCWIDDPYIQDPCVWWFVWKHDMFK